MKKEINDPTNIWRRNDYYVHSTARTTAILNSSVNVFIFGAVNKKFREIFLSLFWQKCKSTKNGENGKSEETEYVKLNILRSEK